MNNDPLQILKWLEEAGADTELGEQPIDRFAESETERQKPAKRAAVSGTIAERAARVQNNSVPGGQGPSAVGSKSGAAVPDEETIASARELADSAGTLDSLREIMNSFEGCNLKRSARNLVFADGNPQAKIMLVGEGPGREEDLQGLPFVGRSGQLLDKMLAAIGLDRNNVYITNVIPWRPPGNRAPTPAEMEICRPFVERHIVLAKPELIVMVGGISAKMLFNTTEGITRIRGQWRTYRAGEREIDAIATLHPAFLLRQPAQKRYAWADLLKIREKAEGLELYTEER